MRHAQHASAGRTATVRGLRPKFQTSRLVAAPWGSFHTWRMHMSKLRHRFRPGVERLEDRVVPYALTGYSWGTTNLTFSFMPDGTKTDNGSQSNLFAKLDAKYSTANWELQFAKALQTWADVTPLNFRLVSDSGADSGASGPASSGSGVGDIRLGGYARTDSYAAYT